jgi:hypothetical protein
MSYTVGIGGCSLLSGGLEPLMAAFDNHVAPTAGESEMIIRTMKKPAKQIGPGGFAQTPTKSKLRTKHTAQKPTMKPTKKA